MVTVFTVTPDSMNRPPTLTDADGATYGSQRFYITFDLLQPVQRVGKEESILGLEPLATIPELRRAYRRLAKANHPDLGPEDEREARTKRMAELNVAYKAAMERRGH